MYSTDDGNGGLFWHPEDDQTGLSTSYGQPEHADIDKMYPHLPQHVRDSLENYQDMIRDGSIKFAPGSLAADEYPGKDGSEDDIRQWVRRHVHYDEYGEPYPSPHVNTGIAPEPHNSDGTVRYPDGR